MNPSRPSTRRGTSRALLLLAALLVLAVLGCLNPFRPLVGTTGARSEPPPRPTSPQQLLLLCKWCWENRSIAEYEELFTDDFRFAFAAVDSADNPPILRDEEIDIARRIIVDGSAGEPRANRIEFNYNSRLVAIPDSRPGKTDPWHKEITTDVVIRVEITEAGSPVTYDVTGQFTFFLVRGDSALIPQQLVDRGFGPDSKRWYIERWEDKTGGSGTGGSAVADGRSAPASRSASAIRATPAFRATSAIRAAPAFRATTTVPPAASSLPPGSISWGEFLSLYRR